MKMTKKSEEILAENPQLKKRMVKDELKRKLLKQPSVIPDKVMKLMEPDLEMRESSQSGSVSDWRQVRMSVDGNQQMHPERSIFLVRSQQYFKYMINASFDVCF